MARVAREKRCCPRDAMAGHNRHNESALANINNSILGRRKKVILKGDLSLIRAECSLKTIEKTWKEEDQGFLIEWQNYMVETEGGTRKSRVSVEKGKSG
ncbi:uncharacterized protein E5676_scaffold180G00700 [Cucumis melo var. makuwa]|uniref:Uncharacterized protein n=1 Tax=Cucumis melo var. makuwa TaxID=1194695 RepID=A0A5A7U4Q5_CUCMM|nr:uncharacterized protein E6C27_scaffold355G00630 [Cucumis melo var. makuwa]TYJ98184.1 uncharacterized protein E5676_scaffold180G00700 [Cucumis melo var. makuwa]